VRATMSSCVLWLALGCSQDGGAIGAAGGSGGASAGGNAGASADASAGASAGRGGATGGSGASGSSTSGGSSGAGAGGTAGSSGALSGGSAGTLATGGAAGSGGSTDPGIRCGQSSTPVYCNVASEFCCVTYDTTSCVQRGKPCAGTHVLCSAPSHCSEGYECCAVPGEEDPFSALECLQSCADWWSLLVCTQPSECTPGLSCDALRGLATYSACQ
jgi:hypothetical protein